jgi:Cu+-exporting ATPase
MQRGGTVAASDGKQRSGAGRFWTSVALAVPLVALSLVHDRLGGHVFSGGWMRGAMLLELGLATIILLGCGWPVLARMGRALRGSGLDAVAGLGFAAVAAYAHGVLAVIVPGVFPGELQNPHGLVEPRFEVAALLVVLALLVRWWRSRTLGTVEPRG